MKSPPDNNPAPDRLDQTVDRHLRALPLQVDSQWTEETLEACLRETPADHLARQHLSLHPAEASDDFAAQTLARLHAEPASEEARRIVSFPFVGGLAAAAAAALALGVFLLGPTEPSSAPALATVNVARASVPAETTATAPSADPLFADLLLLASDLAAAEPLLQESNLRTLNALVD